MNTVVCDNQTASAATTEARMNCLVGESCVDPKVTSSKSTTMKTSPLYCLNVELCNASTSHRANIATAHIADPAGRTRRASIAKSRSAPIDMVNGNRRIAYSEYQPIDTRSFDQARNR